MRRELRNNEGWRLPVLAAAIFFALAPVALGQAKRPLPPAPDHFETARLVWTTLIAIDQANRTGNFTVLRDMAAPEFGKVNDPARLAAVFAPVRRQGLDLSRTVLAIPVYTDQPKVLDNGLYRVAGNFPGRPLGIGFEMLFELVGNNWRLMGVSVRPLASAPVPPAEAEPRKPVPKPAGSGG